MKRKTCILDEKLCTDCGECDYCDLDKTKLCDNCCECLDTADYNAVPIDEILYQVETPQRSEGQRKRVFRPAKR